MKLIRVLFSVLLAFTCCAAQAQQAYPSRPIRIVVPYTPGGFTDLTTRIVAAELSKNFAQNVIIDNRPGANSIVGVEIVSNQHPTAIRSPRSFRRTPPTRRSIPSCRTMR